MNSDSIRMLRPDEEDSADLATLNNPDTPSILSFEEARPLLPKPIVPGYPEWEKMYWDAWETAWRNLHRPQPGSGFVANYIDAGLSPNIYMWDAAFSVQFGFYGRRVFDFMGTLDNFYAKQHPDGFIARKIDSRTGEDCYPPFDPNGTGPNVFAWAEWRYFRLTGDEERLRRVFRPLLNLHNWFKANRTWRNGLYWATGISSGMDNQGRVEDGLNHHQHWAWVDATMQAALNVLALQQMALGLQETDVAKELAEERTQLQQLANDHLWDEESEFYKDLSKNVQFSPSKSIGSYWALLDSRMVPAKRLDGFISHLRQDSAFKRKHRSPSLSADSAQFDVETGDRWRGGVWPPTTFMLLKGLRTVNRHKLAYKVALNHLNRVAQVYHQTGAFWDHYAPDVVAPGKNARRDFVGWAGLTPISILLEDAIGLMTDWPQRRVMWDRRLKCTGFYGVQNYPLGPNHTLDLIGDDKQVIITTDFPITLELRSSEMSLQKAISPGTTEITL